MFFKIWKNFNIINNTKVCQDLEQFFRQGSHKKLSSVKNENCGGDVFVRDKTKAALLEEEQARDYIEGMKEYGKRGTIFRTVSYTHLDVYKRQLQKKVR